jgi:pyruvate, water dikinase
MFLEEIGKRDTAFAGGKGANLDEMFRFHLPVPRRSQSRQGERGLQGVPRRQPPHRVIAKINLEDIDSQDAGARRIRSLIESFPLTGEIAQSVGEANDDLCRPTNKKELRVAVRGLATAEDLRDASFAGQQTTLLNVRGKPALLSAIKRCWASVYTARAILYKAKKGFGTHAIVTAVVVQRQVASEKASVGFTIRPMSGDTNVVVIEGASGRGEASSQAAARPTPSSSPRTTGG